MRHVPLCRHVGLWACVLALLTACSDSAATDPKHPTDLVSEFALLDVNPNSETYDQLVSPAIHLGHVTAWYFGSST